MRHRKGVSVIVGSVMLIIIAIAASIVTYELYVPSMGAQADTKHILENIQIVNVQIGSNATAQFGNITITNTGSVATSLDAFYVKVISSQNVIVPTTDLSGAKNLLPGQTVTIQFTINSAAFANQSLLFSVATARGLVVSQLYSPPVVNALAPTGSNGTAAQLFTISGYVFNDSNCNKVWDQGIESLIPNDVICLVDLSNGQAITVHATNSTGYFTFNGLNKGIYNLISSPPMVVGGCTWYNTTPSTLTTITINNANVTSLSFGWLLEPNNILFSVNGTIFNDLNKDGTMNGADVGITGMVYAINQINGQNFTVTSSGTGFYNMSIPAGYWQFFDIVTQDPGSGYSWYSSTILPVSAWVLNGTSINFGNYVVLDNSTTKYNVSGMVFCDNDSSGTYSNPPDSPLPNWQVVIISGNYSRMTTTSNLASNNGTYFFMVRNGTYTVFDILQSNYAATTATTQTVTVAGGAISGVNFGNKPITKIGNITGYVFSDLDNDYTNVYNSSDAPLQGWDILWYNVNTPTYVLSVATDSNGSYLVTPPATGQYVVFMYPVALWTNCSSLTQNVSLSNQNVYVNFSFVYSAPLNVSGVVYNDSNVNGVYDVGVDNPLGSPSLAIRLTYPNGTTIFTSSDPSTGLYSFTGLTPGTYTVMAFPPPNPWLFSGATQVNFTLTSNSAVVNFGIVNLNNLPKIMASGFVFNDTTASGIFDSRVDNGIPYLPITFYDTLGNSYSAWSNTMGNYSIGLPANLVAYVPINLTNSQVLAVAGFTPVSIYTNWSAYSSYLDNPVDNYAFFSNNGSMLNSWLENGTASNSTNSLIWVQLDGRGIPVGSTTTIYLGFFAKGYDMRGPTNATGWNPTLSSPYAQYDNGYLVFNQYDDFKGTTLNPMWSINNATGGSSGTVTVNNGVDIKCGANDFGIFSSITSQSTGLIAECNFNVINGVPGIRSPALGYGMTSAMSPQSASMWIVRDNNGTSGTLNLQRMLPSMTTLGATPVDGRIVAGNNDTLQLAWGPGGNMSATDLTNGVTTSGTDNTLLLGNCKQVGLFVVNSNTAEFKYYWERVRTMPPANVMPAVAFGSVQSSSSPSFVPLHPGLWSVQLTHAGWTSSTPDIMSFTLAYNFTTQTWSLSPNSTANFNLVSTYLNINFGLYNATTEPVWSIAGMKFNDTNSNGVYDLGTDLPIPNWAIWLYNGTYNGTSSTPIYNTTTNSSGMYGFYTLYKGNYTVIELLNTSWSNTTSRAYYITISGASAWNVNFGNHYNPPSTSYNLTAEVFTDVDHNGQYDPRVDTNVSGQTVYLFDSFSLPIATGLTNSTGGYTFAGLAAGTYSILSGMPSTCTNTTPLTNRTAVPPNQTVYFGQYTTGSAAKYVIGGAKFNDSNSNGVFDSNESGIKSWTIWLFSGSYQTGISTPTAVATTGATGNYSFASLSAGAYTVMELMSSGVNTTARYLNVTITNSSVFGKDFGNLVLSGGLGTGGPPSSGTIYTISGYIFQDNVGNGVYVGTDPGLNSWTVYLCDASGLPIATASTANKGNYSFTVANNTSYTVYYGMGSGYYNTTPKSVTVSVTNSNVTVIFGAAAGKTIAGRVYNDTNGNGVFDGSDAGLSSWNVFIYSGNYTGSTSVTPNYVLATDANGNYTQASLPNGLYTVVEALNSGYTNTTARVRVVNVTSGSISGLDFGDMLLNPVSNPTYAITGFKFYDRDQNGTYDPITDTLIASFPIWISDSSMMPLAKTTTNATGYYAFSYPNGTYYVYENAAASGYINSTVQAKKITVLNGAVTGVNFGNYITGAKQLSLYGYVFNDTDDSGTYNSAVDGVLGSQSVLFYTIINGQLWYNFTLTTNGSGFFSYSLLPPGTYQLDMVKTGILTSYTATTPLSVNITLSASTRVDFGWYFNSTTSTTYSISGMVFNDTVGNGVYNSSVDGPLANTLVALWNSSYYFTPVSTDASGNYIYSGLGTGTYTIDEIPLSGYTNTTSSQMIVTITNGSQTLNFGNCRYVPPPQFSVTGFLFNDLLHNGTYLPSMGDTPLSGWVIGISNSKGSLPGVNTNSTGYFVFNNLTADTYTITPMPSQYGWINSTPNPITLYVNSSVSGLVFGYYNTNPTSGYNISGTVYNDLNKDGNKTAGEPGIQYWYVVLTNGSSSPIATETDASGNYIFTGLANGTYTIINTPPEGSDAWTNTTSMSTSVTLSSASVTNINFGEFYNNFTVSGYVFLDVNKNGVYDVGTDYPVPGMLLNLTGTSGTQLISTDSNGLYQFTNNQFGNYTLTEESSLYWNCTQPTVNISLQSNYNQNFAMTRSFQVGNYSIFTTYTESAWSADSAQYLANYFASVYSPYGQVTIGINDSNSQHFHIRYSNLTLMCQYLNNGESVKILSGQPANDGLNPSEPPLSEWPGGMFGADILALQLNCNYSTAGILYPGFGSLTLYNYDPVVNGMTVNQILNAANQVLGNNTAANPWQTANKAQDLANLDTLIAQLNQAFSTSDYTWANSHLF